MDAMMLLRTFAAVTTIVAAALVAANWNARVMVAGFAIFIVASLAWMADGWLEGKASLVIQNVILLAINVLGVWRWFPRAEKEMTRLALKARLVTGFAWARRDGGSAPSRRTHRA